jgi:L-2-hydroxyglutarate oxidase LhgO
MRYFAGAAVDNHARIVYKAKVAEIEHLSGGYKVTVADTTGNFSFLTTILINAAGLNSAQIAGLAGIDIAKAGYELHYCKGEYFSIPRRLSTRLVYPMPRADEGGLGVHITPDLEGKMRMGPNAIYVDSIDYKVDESGKQKFYESAKKLFPAIKYDELEPDFAGIRPKLQGKGEGFRDFVIRHEHDKGLDGLINLIGIESPGLTASPAIGRYVKSMVDQIS